jgi:hypothetical protein
MPIEIDKTIRIRDILFMAIFIIIAYFVMQYDIKQANICIEKINNYTNLLNFYNASSNYTINITELID